MNNAIPIEKRQSLEKPITTKDIANLYSHLQTMMENAPKSPRMDNVMSLEGFMLTPTTSTSSSNLAKKNNSKMRASTLPARKSRDPDCACHHIFVSKDSEYCGLCDDVISILSEIQRDREEKQKQIKDSEGSLNKEKMQSEKFQQEIARLTKESEHVNEALKRTQEQFSSLKEEMKVLELKCTAEEKEAAKARKEKADVENELEELSQKLFEEANEMVAKEKKEKHALETQYKLLEDELKLCQEQMEVEELQLKELKLKMGLLDDRSATSVSSLDNTNEHDDSAEHCALGGSLEGSAHNQDSALFSDENEGLSVMEEFEEFVKFGAAAPIRKLHSSSTYMKNSLIEDIEPCLRFGPNSRLSQKKLYEAILLNTCFIEESPHDFAHEQAKQTSETPLKISASKNMIWERLSSTSTVPFSGCQACGRETKNLPYRFRISILDDWACIDRRCRDQLVSVCEFYVFIRKLRQGHYSGRSIPDLYQESLRLKLQMFYARTGASAKKFEQLGVEGNKMDHTSESNTTTPLRTTSSVLTESLYVTENFSTQNDINSQTKELEMIEKTHYSVHPSNSVWIPYTS